MEYDKSLSVCFFFGGGERGEGGLFFWGVGEGGGGRGEGGGTHLLPVSNQSSLHSIRCSSITL